MIDNRSSKRTTPSDDDGEQTDESSSAERNSSSRRSPTFPIKPGPASWKRSFYTQPYPIRRSLGSSSRKPGAVASKTASAVDEKTAGNFPEATFPRLRNDSKESKIGIDNDEKNFIHFVSQCPHLYSRKHHYFRDATKKEKSWAAISEIVGMSAEDSKVRWKAIRNRYCRERKKLPQHIDPDFRDLMENELKFLDSVIRPRRTIGFPRDQDSRALSAKQAGRDQRPRIIMSLKTGQNASTPAPTLRRAANAGNNSASHDGSAADEENEEEEEEEEEEDPIGPLINAISTPSRMKQSQDIDQLYASTLAVRFRQLPPKYKNKVFGKCVRYFDKIERKME